MSIPNRTVRVFFHRLSLHPGVQHRIDQHLKTNVRLSHPLYPTWWRRLFHGRQLSVCYPHDMRGKGRFRNKKFMEKRISRRQRILFISLPASAQQGPPSYLFFFIKQVQIRNSSFQNRIFHRICVPALSEIRNPVSQPYSFPGGQAAAHDP